MPRPKCQRRIGHHPAAYYFKPQGIPMTALAEVGLAPDEIEAVRLADLERLYHEAAAERMAISRATFGRILDSAHHKIAGALVHGRALRLEGREAYMPQTRVFICDACGHRWELPFGTGRPAACPQCHSNQIERSSEGNGHGRHGRDHMGGGEGRRRQRRSRNRGRSQGDTRRVGPARQGETS